MDSGKKTAKAGKESSSSWRGLFHEVDEEEEKTTAVLFCYSGELEDGHGDCGGRRQWRFFSRYLTERCMNWRKKKGRRGAGEEGSELGFCQHLVYMEGKRGKWQAS
jgi:hypothetical protein